MYKTTVYTLVNGRITHQKPQISGKKADGAVGELLIRELSRVFSTTLLSSTLTLWQCEAA